jgi:hypothetical protein
MKATDYDKLEPIFRNIIDDYEKKCNESNISINFCYNSLMYKFQKYLDSKNLIK